MCQIGGMTLLKAQEVCFQRQVESVGCYRGTGPGIWNPDYSQGMVEARAAAQSTGLAPGLGVLERKYVTWRYSHQNKRIKNICSLSHKLISGT